MAIGARISSTNLSGKTATVTFTPYTGTTSGTTVNLGAQTIPFNNITTHPYGDYALYLAEYDYTYTLNVPQPDAETQLFVWTDSMFGEYNYGAATFNFNDLTASIIDLGVATGSWNLNNLYPLDGLGFGYQFNGQNNGADRLVIFTDSTNVEIERYSGNTNNYNFNELDGRWITFNDSDNGIFKYSNGVNVYTYTYDSSRYSVDIQWDYDATMSDGSFILAKYDEAMGIDNNAYIFKTDGTQTLLKTWNYIGSDFDYNFFMQYNDDFIVIEEFNFNNDSKTQLEIYDTSATLLETVVLSGATYNGRYYGFHGTNKFFYVTYDYNDINTAYKIIHYNSNTTTLIETSHVRGTEYQNINTNYGSYYNDPVSNNVEGLVISLNDNTNSWDGWTYSINYFDAIYMLDGDSAFSTYTYANDESKSIVTWWQLSDILRTRVNTGDGNASILTIMSGGTHIESLGVATSSIGNSNDWELDNRTVIMLWDTSYVNVNLFLIGENGVLQDQKSFAFTQAYGNNNVNSAGGKSFYGYFVTTSGETSYYINDTVTGFTETSIYDSIYDTWRFVNPGQRDETTMILFNEGASLARILNADSLSSEFSLPSWNSNFYFLVGRDKFLYAYNDSENNYYHVKLYDFSGNTINTLDTIETNINGLYGGKDRYVAVFYNGDIGRNKVYMITPSMIEGLTIESNNTYYTPNDTNLWND